MIGNHRLYRFFAEQFHIEVQGALFSHAISFAKDALLLHFIKNNNSLCYELKFIDGELLIAHGHWVDERSKKKLNALLQFKDLEGKCLVGISFGLFDRVFTLNFSEGYTLLFKGYGKFGNVLLFKDSETFPIQMFRLNYKKDWDLRLDSIKTHWQEINQPWNPIQQFKDEEIWNQMFKSISAQEISKTHPDFWNLSETGQNEVIKLVQDPYRQKPKFHILNNRAAFSWSDVEEQGFEDLKVHLTAELRNYFRWFFYEKEKEHLTSEYHKNLKSLQIRENVLTQRIQLLTEQRDFKELGDLILSNAHAVKKGVSEALLSDFFTGQRIRIKLNPDLSAAENAEKFYRKAKNKNIELQTNESQLKDTLEQLKAWEHIGLLIDSANEAKDFKSIKEAINELKPGSALQKSKLDQPASTYKKLNLDGFEVWVGKNAKSNDSLLRDAQKNDIWLHAADVPGSHVLIRTNGRALQKQTIEKAASIAAFYSKGKSQHLQTVIFTERKYLSKAKNAAPGEVKVSKFQTLDVQPALF